MNDKLRQLQLCELEILKEFVRICDKYNLRYYLVGGTLLGAVRHQRFIPWDDDIDVGMPREDYDRFAELCTSELDTRYFYQTPDTDPHYFLTYAKLRKNDTEVYEDRFKDSMFHKGIFIDIFPLDYCPEPGPVCHFLFNVLAVMNYRGQVDSGEVYRPYEELIGKFGYRILSVFSARNLTKIRKAVLLLSKKLSSGRYVASYSGAYGYAKEVYPAEWFGSKRRLEFETLWWNVPEYTEMFLTRWYGSDFQQIPSEEKRKKHIELDDID